MSLSCSVLSLVPFLSVSVQAQWRGAAGGRCGADISCVPAYNETVIVHKMPLNNI